MDRKQFLLMCKEVSTMKDGPLRIKIGIPSELLVKYDGTTYYPDSFIRRYKDGQKIDVAVLHSLKTHSIIEVDVEKVEVINNVI